MAELTGATAAIAQRFEAIIFDWDGTAVPDREADASPVRERVENLCLAGVDVAVVSGTHLENIDGQLRARPPGPGHLYLSLNRGSEVFRVVADGPQLLYRREPAPGEEGALTAAAALLMERLAARGLESRIVTARLNRRKIDGVGAEGDAVTIPEHSIESFERTIRLNITSGLIQMKYVIPLMVAHGGGSIVSMGSVSSVLGNPRDVAYTVAKHGVIGLTRAAASEWGHCGVRANVVCPAPIESSLMAALEAAQPVDAGAVRTWYTTQTPAGRYGQPEEVADAVSFLISDQSTYINGSVIMLDGGLTASGRPA